MSQEDTEDVLNDKIDKLGVEKQTDCGEDKGIES